MIEILIFWEIYIFWFVWNEGILCKVDSENATFGWKLLQRLLFLKIGYSVLWRHIDFEEVALLLIFGSNDGKRSGAPTTLSLRLSPGSITTRNQRSRSGNLSLRLEPRSNENCFRMSARFPRNLGHQRFMFSVRSHVPRLLELGAWDDLDVSFDRGSGSLANMFWGLSTACDCFVGDAQNQGDCWRCKHRGDHLQQNYDSSSCRYLHFSMPVAGQGTNMLPKNMALSL